MEPFENDKNQNTEHIMAENMTSAPAKRYEGKSSFSQIIPSQEKIIQVLCTTFGLDPEGMGDTLVLHNGDIEIRLAVASESAGEKAEEFIKRQVEGTCDHFYQVNKVLWMLRPTCCTRLDGPEVLCWWNMPLTWRTKRILRTRRP